MNEFYKYLTLGKDDMDWGIYLNVAGFSEIAPGMIYPSTGHPTGYYFTWERGRILKEYQINYITEGSGVIETESGKYKIGPGSLLILKPGVWHRYRPVPSKGWKEHFIGFEGDFADHILKQYPFTQTGPLIHLGFQEKVMESFHRIIDEVKEERSGYQQVCSGLLVEILGRIVSVVRNKEFEGKEIDIKVRNARVYLRDHLDQSVNIEKLASDLNMGYSYFRKMFKKYTGLSPVQYHLLLRLRKSRDLLVSTDKSVKEIAEEMGFQSIYYFTRIFKQKMGATPTSIRRNYSRKYEMLFQKYRNSS